MALLERRMLQAAESRRPLVHELGGLEADVSLFDGLLKISGGVTSAVPVSELDHGGLAGLGDDDHVQYLLADGTRALSADWDAGSHKVKAQQVESDVGAGTAPLIVASDTVVTNLNADKLDGNDATAFAGASHEHAATAITSGVLAHERGGLEADVSGYDGLVKISGGGTSSKSCPSGDVVGTSDTQTLSAKTLTTPTIGSFVNAQHDHSNAAGGGSLAAKYRRRTGFVEIPTPAVGDEFVIAWFDDALTLEQVRAHVEAATSITYSIYERSYDTPDSTSGQSIVVNADTATTTPADATIADSAIAGDKCLVLEVTAVSGTPSKAWVFWRGTVD